MLFIVDQSKRRNATGFQSQVLVHASLRSKTQLALMQTMLQIVDVHLVHALEQYQIVLVAFVVPEKQVFAMGGVEFLPVVDGLLYSGDGRMEMDIEFDAETFQRVNDLLLTLAHGMGNVVRMHFS